MDSEAGKLFVGGLHWNTTDEGMKAYFEQFGQVTGGHIMRDPTGKSRCFGFVSFADPSVLDAVVSKTHILDNKQIDPKRAVPKHLQQQTPPSLTPGYRPSIGAKPIREENKIFVGGIHIAVEEPELAEFFSKYGEVVECVLMRDRETGRSRGFGFVTFAEHSTLQEVCKNQYLEYQGRRMEIKMAVPKGRQAQPSIPQINPSQCASTMQDYYNAYSGGASVTAPPAQLPAAAYSDPKAYMDAMIAAYTAAYGPEMAAAAAAYYAPYLNINSTASVTQEQNSSTSTTNISSNVDTSSDRSKHNRNRSRSRSPRRGRSRSPSRTRSRSRSPSRDYRNDRRRVTDRERSYRRDRSRSRSRSSSPPPPPPPRRDRERSPEDSYHRPSSRRY